ncbi:uncharacterized protein TM35_001451000, partial [Trypanosoma theileri]
MTKAVMVRCYLLCLLTLALCCACGLVWADSPKTSDALIKTSTVGVPSRVHRAVPAEFDLIVEEEETLPTEAEKEVVPDTPCLGAGGSCPSASDSSNSPCGRSSGGNGGGRTSSSDSLSETGVRGADIAPGVQPQQHPTLPHQQSAPGATCTQNSSNLPCTTTPEELTPPKPIIPTPEKPGTGALVDAPSNKDGHRAADRTGAQVTLGESAPEIGSGSGTDDTSSSSSDHSTASPPPAASPSASDPQYGNSDNHASTAADNQ